MKLINLEEAMQLMKDRKELMASHDAVYEAKENYLGITLQGRYQNDEFVAACRQTVSAELVRRIRLIEDRLSALGVEVQS